MADDDDVGAALTGRRMTPEELFRATASNMSLQPRDVPPPADPYETQLNPYEEEKFQIWKQQYAPHDSGADYDLRGAFKAGLTPDPATGHWVDTFKKPNHPTFSDQSMYAKDRPDLAGSWNGETYIPPMRR